MRAVVEDGDLNRQLATALTDAGYVVDRAFDGEEDIISAKSEPYDAIILDIGLPKMDGISVLESTTALARADAGPDPSLRATVGATRCRASMPAPAIM